MAEEVTLKEVRPRLTKLIEEVGRGKEFALTSHGKIVARLVPPLEDRNPTEVAAAAETQRLNWAARNPEQAGRDALLAKIRSR